MFSRIGSRCAGRTVPSSPSNLSYQRLASFLNRTRLPGHSQKSEALSTGVCRFYATEGATDTTVAATTETTAPASTPGRPRKAGRPKKPAAEKKTAKKPGPANKGVRPKKKASKTPPKTTTGKPRGRPTTKKAAVTPALVAFRKVSELRKQALMKGPKMLPQTAYMAFSAEGYVKSSGSLTEQVKTIVEKYKGLSTSEREHYENIARANKTTNEKTMSEWIESHTPDEIRVANNARRQLNRISKQPKAEGSKYALVGGGLRLIKDPRKITKPGSAFMVFTRERWSSGDFKGQAPTDVAKTLSAEWKSINEAEKQGYLEKFKQNTEQYNKDYLAIFTRGRKKPAVKATT